MLPETFAQLCTLLRTRGQLKDTRHASVEEQVAIFIYAIAHNVRNCVLQVVFRRSGETISRYFHRVLEAIISLEDQFLIQPDGTSILSEIMNNNRFYPYFKDCIGAIDGTHVRVKVSNSNAPRYRVRKNWLTQNVLAACTFDLKFTYVLPGWEGTTSDSRIIKDELNREYRLHTFEGKYYLVDAGFMLTGALLTPYRGVRYHLKEYSFRAPENAQELFNLRHASLRNAIERAFGVLKKRFAIIASSTEPHYTFDTQRDVFLACCILHNFLMSIDPDEELIAEVDRELLNSRRRPRRNAIDEDTEEGKIIRDNIASQMWNAYVL
uniref:Nuclease HARBI1 n=2 Tax=Chenopodium quinoa TaxID=63459 RepID=A0A803L9I9_CHEQI